MHSKANSVIDHSKRSEGLIDVNVGYKIPAKLIQHKYSVWKSWEAVCQHFIPNSKPMLITTQLHRYPCCSKGTEELLIIKVMNRYNEIVGNPHAEISRNGEDFYIRNLQIERGTFVNGLRLENGEKRRLVNDDMISLGMDHEDPGFKQWAKEGRPIPESVFKFKSSREKIIHEAPGEITTPEHFSDASQTLSDKVLQNSIILKKLFHCLTMSELKTARLVCKGWDHESMRKFCIWGSFHVPGVACPHWKTLKEMPRIIPIQHAILELSSVPIPIKHWLNSAEEEADWILKPGTFWHFEMNKYLDNVIWFSKTYGKSLKTLKLDLMAQDWDTFTKFMPNLENLNSLQLKITAKGNFEIPLSMASFSKTLPLLKELEFSYLEPAINSATGESNEIPMVNKIALIILNSFPNLEWIKYTQLKAFDTNLGFFATLKQNKELMPNVESFSIFHQFETCLMSHETSLSNKLWEIDFVKPLKRLEITNIPYGTSQTVVDLIGKHSPSLTHLTLGVQNPGRFFRSTGYPICPRLATLKIMVYNQALKHDPMEPPLPRVNYSECFPQLQMLIFDRNRKFKEYKYPLIVQHNESFYPFVPESQECCLSVQDIILPVSNRQGSDLGYTTFILQLCQGFPNANKDEERFQQGRRGDWHLLKDDGIPINLTADKIIELERTREDLDTLQRDEDEENSVDEEDSSEDSDDDGYSDSEYSDDDDDEMDNEYLMLI